MTREQLIDLRQKKKRKKRLMRLGITGGILMLALLIGLGVFAVYRKRHPVIRIEPKKETSATRKALTDPTLGVPGWNYDSEGWWFRNDDDTRYVNGWQKRTIDLTPYAGKDVYLAFRHYDCTGQYILRLDDVFAFEKGTADPTGISYLKTDENNKVARNEYYNLSGERLNAPIQGVNIVRSTYPDGTVRTHKVLLK